MNFPAAAGRKPGLSLFFLAACAGSGTKSEPNASLPNPEGPALIVLYASDLHSQIRPDELDRGGYARLKAWFDAEKRKAGPQTDVIVVAGGDTLGKGALPCAYTGDQACVPLLGQLGFDYATPGNYELYRSNKDLRDILPQTKASWLSANVKSKEKLPWTEGTSIYKGPKSGIQLGLVGWTSDPSYNGDPRGRKDYTVKRRPDALDWNKFRIELSGKPILFLTHQEIAEDRSFLAQACKELGARWVMGVLKANDHVYRRHESQFCAPILEPGPFAHEAAKVVIVKQPNGDWKLLRHEFVHINKLVGEDAQLKAAVEDVYKKHGAGADDVLAKLSASRSQKEVARWVAGAYRERTKADVGLVNVGYVKGPLSEGKLTREKVLVTMPYSNELMGVDWSAKDMEAALCKASKRALDDDADYGSEIVLDGATLENPGKSNCHLVTPAKKALLKVAIDSYVVSRSGRWLGEDLAKRSFRFGVGSQNLLFLQLEKQPGSL
jgi:2',3'-cyclic-nucleotide 2'-phosphodiesterase (5'-nucleotidase family)